MTENTCVLPPAGMRMINDAGLDLVESFEGCSLKAYWDSLGSVWTIGYGHTGPDVHEGQEITQAQANTLLAMDLGMFSLAVSNMLGEAPTTDNQFAAMVSFAYNVGSAALKGSIIMTDHLKADYAGAAADFSHWDHAGGQVVRGLLRRRQAEAALYLTP